MAGSILTRMDSGGPGCVSGSSAAEQAGTMEAEYIGWRTAPVSDGVKSAGQHRANMRARYALAAWLAVMITVAACAPAATPSPTAKPFATVSSTNAASPVGAAAPTGSEAAGNDRRGSRAVASHVRSHGW
jgi:hypothetical protein